MSDFTTHFITANRFLKDKNFSPDFCRAFYFGVQGPDLFFFHTPVKGGDGMNLGSYIHNQCPKEMFELDFESLKDKSDLFKGYYFGMLLHFFGDEMMHQYIGYLVKKYPYKYAHITFERDIDVQLYPLEFGKSVNTFKPKDFYILDDALTQAVYEFWKMRAHSDKVTYKFVKRCLINTVAFTSVFTKSNKALVGFLGLFGKEKRFNALTGHFKFGDHKEILNLNHQPWTSPEGEVYFSVPDFLDITMTRFLNEYDKITNAMENGAQYQFTNEHSFSYGCED